MSDVNKVRTRDEDTYVCDCGAEHTGRHGLKRFLNRHPRICNERKQFTHQLAGGVKSVDDQSDIVVGRERDQILREL